MSRLVTFWNSIPPDLIELLWQLTVAYVITVGVLMLFMAYVYPTLKRWKQQAHRWLDENFW